MMSDILNTIINNVDSLLTYFLYLYLLFVLVMTLIEMHFNRKMLKNSNDDADFWRKLAHKRSNDHEALILERDFLEQEWFKAQQDHKDLSREYIDYLKKNGDENGE